MKNKLEFRLATLKDFPHLEEIRKVAFSLIFESFRSILGEEIYTLAQEPEDKEQVQLLKTMLETDFQWDVYVSILAGNIVGFVSFKIEQDTKLGEIGLNAIHPEYTGKGLGTDMYKFALEKMKLLGARVATVATGGDPSHEAARRAYEKASFNVQIPSVWMCTTLEK